MINTDLGLPSASTAVSTYQQNRESEIAQLEFNEVNFNQLVYELLKVKKELSYHKAQSTFYLNQSNRYQEKVLEMQDKILNHYEIGSKPYMKVAD